MKSILKGVIAAAMLTLPQVAAADGTLYFGISGEPTTMEPMMQTGTTFRTVKLAIHRGLVNYDVDGSISNELAERYEISDDGLRYTFHLRDALFHDGRKVTANDVKASLDRIRDPESSASFRNAFATVTEINVIDDKTIELVLERPNMALIHYLALPESVVVPADWIDAFAADQNVTPVGAGPFRFTSWQRGREIVVQAFDGYYKEGKPHLDEVHYVFYADENTRVNAIRSGDVDIIDYVPARELESLEADPNIRNERTFGPFMGLHFNTRFEPFSHPKVRQAISYAVDRSAIINTAFNGVGTPIYGLPIPEGYMAWSEEATNYFTHDVEKARELMAEAGYADGFEVKLLASSQYSFHQNTAVAIQSELAKIGIKVSLELPDWAGRMTRAFSGDYQFMVLGSLGEITDADWLSDYFYGGEQLVRNNNSAYFQDDEIDQLLDQARETVDPDERAKLYERFTKRANELSPMAFFMWRDQSYAVRENVSGFTNMPAFLSFQSGFSIENTKIE